MAIPITHRKVFGRVSLLGTLLDAVEATTDGEWVQLAGFNPVTIALSGISGDTVHVCGSNAQTRPANNTHGFQLGPDITADGYVIVDLPVEWVKARVSVYGAGTIVAELVGSESA